MFKKEKKIDTEYEIMKLQERISDLEDVIFAKDYFTKEKILKAKSKSFIKMTIGIVGGRYPGTFYCSKENYKLYKSAILAWEKEINNLKIK